MSLGKNDLKREKYPRVSLYPPVSFAASGWADPKPAQLGRESTLKSGMGEYQHQVSGRYRPYFKVSVLLKVVDTSSRDVRQPFELHSSPQGGAVPIITRIAEDGNTAAPITKMFRVSKELCRTQTLPNESCKNRCEESFV